MRPRGRRFAWNFGYLGMLQYQGVRSKERPCPLTGRAPQSSAAGNDTYVPSCTSGLRRRVPEAGVWSRDEQSPGNFTNGP